MVVFLYTNNEAAEREIKKSIPFIIEPSPIKYLTKEVKSIYPENSRKIMKEIEEDTKHTHTTTTTTKTFHAHGLEEQMLLKCQSYLKQSTNSMHSLSKWHQHSSQS